MAEKLFSEAWIEQARVGEQAATDKVYQVFKNPPTFSHVLAFEVNEHPDVIMHVTYVEGRVAKWSSTDLAPEDEVWARFKANLEHFKDAIEGRTPAANLVMAGKMRLVKGHMSDAVENARPLNELVKSWGVADTDWDL